MPSAGGISSDQYQKHRARAIGLFSSVFPIGGIVGPNLGGYILEHWRRRELFFINVPIGIVARIGAWLLLKEPRVAWRRPSLDPVGLVLYAGALALLIYAITVLADAPELWRSPGLWALFVTSFGLSSPSCATSGISPNRSSSIDWSGSRERRSGHVPGAMRGPPGVRLVSRPLSTRCWLTRSPV
jgi:MFS family permease